MRKLLMALTPPATGCSPITLLYIARQSAAQALLLLESLSIFQDTLPVHQKAGGDMVRQGSIGAQLTRTICGSAAAALAGPWSFLTASSTSATLSCRSPWLRMTGACGVHNFPQLAATIHMLIQVAGSASLMLTNVRADLTYA